MAQNSRQVSVGTGASVLLWQTSTGVPPDPATALQGGTTGIFMARMVGDPLPILIENLDTANPVFLGPSGVTSASGTRLAAGGSITRNVIGNDSEFAISTGGTVLVAVEVGRQ